VETVLIWLTLIILAVVALVLAASLILIAIALIRADRNLKALAGGLDAIRDNVNPLASDLTTINTAAVALRDQLRGVDGNLQRIIRVFGG
jgi:hypothetical protein